MGLSNNFSIKTNSENKDHNPELPKTTFSMLSTCSLRNKTMVGLNG